MIHNKGLTAKSLYQKSNRDIVRTIVQDQIRIIDSKISLAHQSGFNHIKHDLPVNFNINNMEKADSQLMVYSDIIMQYKTPEPEGKGFPEVYIDFGNDTADLYIYWVNGMDNKERERRNKIILSSIISPGGSKQV